MIWNVGPDFDTWQLVVWNVLAGALWLFAVIDIIRLFRRSSSQPTWVTVALVFVLALQLYWRGAYLPIAPAYWLLRRGKAWAEIRAPREPDGTQGV